MQYHAVIKSYLQIVRPWPNAHSMSHPSYAIASMAWPLLILWAASESHALRCYTDVEASKSHSVECGLNTGCVKIYIDTEEMMMRRQAELGYGYGMQPPDGVPPLPERYMGNPVIRRGCFVLAVPDRCYTANNGLSYCWCSQKDLCNSGFRLEPHALIFIAVGLVMDIFMRRLLLRT